LIAGNLPNLSGRCSRQQTRCDARPPSLAVAPCESMRNCSHSLFSNRTKRTTYAQPFPGPSAKLQISAVGGTHPQWNRNGKELFYIAGDVQGRHPCGVVRDHLVEVPPSAQRQQYAVSLDGQRFLMNVPIESADVSPITVVLNWNPAAKKRC
jgi:hypothetical protein